MVRITEELVRKKAEHNECIIGTLEELSLHQEDVEKIEHLNNWCKELQILYLQSNLISKIENLNKLKKLRYLNLAVNNIEVIENLEGCESLEKLDLTLNFIGDLKGVWSLKHNQNLEDLYLTGNPCCDFENYREYVITVLPHIKRLDNVDISRSERLKGLQSFDKNKVTILQAEREYKIFRENQKQRLSENSTSHLSDEDFWKSTSEHCPEIRYEMAERQQKAKNDKKSSETKTEKMVKLFGKDGRPLNINRAKVNFTFDDQPDQFVLDLAIYKFLDTNLIEVDLQPIFVTVKIKGKIFQFVFPEEVLTDSSICQRSQTTGHLVLKLKKLNPKLVKFSKAPEKIAEKENTDEKDKESNKNVYLEVDDSMDFSKIVENKMKPYYDPEIPPLEYA